MRLTGLIWIALLFAPSEWLAAQEESDTAPASTENLRQKASEILKLAETDNVEAAKQSESVFEFAERLQGEGKHSDARQFFENAFRLSPWSIGHYLSYAKTLGELGDDKRAKRWARIAFERAEDTATRDGAQKWLSEKSEPRLPLWDGKGDGRAICLVTLGDPPDWLVQRCAKGLHNILGIPVFTLGEKIQLPNSDRSSFQRWVSGLRANVQWEKPEVRLFLREIGLPTTDLTDRQVLTAIEAIIRANRPPEELENFRRMKFQLGNKRYDQQWDAMKLWEIIAESVKSEANQDILWLGVTNVDLFGGNANFVFGMAASPPNCAIVSCARFSADFNGEPPDSNRLAERLLKQMLSSVGNLLGAPRSMEPTCPRSFPQSLAEHDAKSLTLCDECRESISRAIQKPLPVAPARIFANKEGGE